MRGDCFEGEAIQTHGGACHGLRYVPTMNSSGGEKNPTYDRYLGCPHPCLFSSSRRPDYRTVYALGVRDDDGGASASAWHTNIKIPRAAARRISVKADRRQRRARVHKKMAARGGRRRFAKPAFVRRLNKGTSTCQ